MFSLCCQNKESDHVFVASVPVTSLPRDRLSQVTRRGMVTDTKRLQAAEQSEERQAGYLRTAGLGRGIVREQTRMKDREEVNVRDPLLGATRVLRPDESKMVRITHSLRSLDNNSR